MQKKIAVALFFNLVFMGVLYVENSNNRKFQCSHLSGQLVNIDKVRNKFLQYVEFAYTNGCRYGTDYPQMYRYAVGFNPNSPVIYCGNRYKKDMVDYYTIEMLELTK